MLLARRHVPSQWPLIPDLIQHLTSNIGAQVAKIPQSGPLAQAIAARRPLPTQLLAAVHRLQTVGLAVSLQPPVHELC